MLFELIALAQLLNMNTFAFCFLALFAGTLAVPVFKEDVVFNFVENVRDNEDKIVGGNETTIETHPYQLSFRWNNNFICGGSVLTPTRGLTASHCLRIFRPAEKYSIMVGSTLLKGDDNAQFRQLTAFMRHPLYNRHHHNNDVALLYWEEPLTLGATVHAITLPLQDSPVPYGENCNVTGWGRTREGGPVSDNLRVTTKPIVTNEECNVAYKGRVTPDMLCAGLPQGGRDTCQGDSGGPLTVNGVQLGVISWGRGCARPKYPGVYARVAFFSNWILENL